MGVSGADLGELTATIGADLGQRVEGRTEQCNGHRLKMLTTAAGDIEVGIPKLRVGSFFPSILERRRRIDRALFAVVMETYVHRVSTRSVDDLVKALGAASGISDSEVSRIVLSSTAISRRSVPVRSRANSPLRVRGCHFVKARVRGRVVSRAVVVATGVGTNGGREVLGLAVGDGEDDVFRAGFFPSSRSRGLSGVKLVISDHHLGLKKAISEVFVGASWQRCPVHHADVGITSISCATCWPASTDMVAAAIRTIFAQPDAKLVKTPRRDRPHPHPQVPMSPMREDARSDLLAFAAFPVVHWKKIWSTNPLGRLNGEIKRRTWVVGIFPNDASVLRLVTAVVVETHDEWQVAQRRYLSEESIATLATIDHTGHDPLPEAPSTSPPGKPDPRRAHAGHR